MADLALDTAGMLDATLGLPDQIAAAVGTVGDLEGLPNPDRIRNVLVLGMGGSGIVGDLLSVVAGPYLPVPVLTIKGYEPPSYVDDHTLVFAVSFSGNTLETLQAVETAHSAGAHIVAVTTGGELARRVSAWGQPVVRIDSTIPQPRAGIGAAAIPTLVVLEDLGLFRGASEWIRLAVDQLRRRRDRLVLPNSPARVLARRLQGTFPLIWGGGGPGGLAATRWKTQFNENTKLAAFASEVPEMCHNEIAGFGLHGDVTRQVFSVIQLRHDDEHPLVMTAFDVLTELVEEVVADVHTVRAEGEGRLAQVLDLFLWGDLVSLFVAEEAGIDPGPVPALDAVKARLRA
ncbi:MAG: bifunctional phosphoglucose/phosphomannose isomerase [Acidimicrobiales bacterium]|nr:bifunctional phosphoglucose/phosphomannose isomerase [Acidimicrobiales bacterium]